MIRFILARLGVLIPTFIGVTFVAFILIRLVPGDPVELLVGERGVSPERHAQLMAQLGLDKPAWRQYVGFLDNLLLHGDLGHSIVTREPVAREFFRLFPATVELSFVALLIAVAVGLPAGIIAAVRRGSALDHVVMGAALTGYSMPIFWWGLLLIIVFAAGLHWFPVQGRMDLAIYFKPVTGLKKYISEIRPDTGVQCSVFENRTMSSRPHQKIGIE